MSQRGIGVISAGEVYTLPEFQARVGFKRYAMKAARLAGLPVRYRNSKGFVIGREAVEFFASAPLTHAGGETSPGLAPAKDGASNG